jgi:ABC-type transporter Mla maintaining outer membrane lipid asymmetry permease subunit MlaE
VHMQNIGSNPTRGFNRNVRIFGRAVRLFFDSFSPTSLREMDRATFVHYFSVMGLRSLPLITFGSILVSLALTTQVVLEAERFKAQDMAGAAIAIGLLRELAPLTVGLTWAARTCAFLTETAFAERKRSEHDFSGDFLAPAYLAAIAAALPLAAYGLVVGFGAAALYAPCIGVTSSADFLESARLAIKDKDVVVYLLKLVVINPTIVIFATCLTSLSDTSSRSSVTAAAVTWTAILVFTANLVCTWAWYLP